MAFSDTLETCAAKLRWWDRYREVELGCSVAVVKRRMERWECQGLRIASRPEVGEECNWLLLSPVTARECKVVIDSEGEGGSVGVL